MSPTTAPKERTKKKTRLAPRWKVVLLDDDDSRPVGRSLVLPQRGEGGENVMKQHGQELASGVWEYMGRATAALDQPDE
ncbi:MAG: hypothetical protein GY711_02925 [bacterium]|nr:hypothetical protein [bacterium]